MGDGRRDKRVRIAVCSCGHDRESHKLLRVGVRGECIKFRCYCSALHTISEDGKIEFEVADDDFRKYISNYSSLDKYREYLFTKYKKTEEIEEKEDPMAKSIIHVGVAIKTEGFVHKPGSVLELAATYGEERDFRLDFTSVSRKKGYGDFQTWLKDSQAKVIAVTDAIEFWPLYTEMLGEIGKCPFGNRFIDVNSWVAGIHNDMRLSKAWPSTFCRVDRQKANKIEEQDLLQKAKDRLFAVTKREDTFRIKPTGSKKVATQANKARNPYLRHLEERTLTEMQRWANQPRAVEREIVALEPEPIPAPPNLRDHAQRFTLPTLFNANTTHPGWNLDRER